MSPQQLAVGPAPRDALMLRFARLAGFDLIYDRPRLIHTGSYQGRGTLEGPITEILDRLQLGAFVWTHHRGLVLARDPDRERVDRDASLPWQLTRRLEESAARGDGYSSPDLWPELVRLRRDQVEALSNRLPDAGLLKTYQPVFLLYTSMKPAERAQAASARGIGWQQLGGPSRGRLLALLPEADAREARLVVRLTPQERPRSVALYLGPPRPEWPIVVRPLGPLKSRESVLTGP